jgi:hypothetical protein
VTIVNTFLQSLSVINQRIIHPRRLCCCIITRRRRHDDDDDSSETQEQQTTSFDHQQSKLAFLHSLFYVISMSKGAPSVC